MRHFSILFYIILFGLRGYSQKRLGISPKSDTSVTSITTKLNIPFGTIAKLEVEVYDGDSLQMKAYESTYLLKVNAVNGKKIADTLILKFIDETETLANDDFSLYKLIFGKTAKSITGKQINKLEKRYIGKKFTVLAYETGHFTGVPDEYFNYRPLKAGTGFYFEDYLIIVSIITK